MRVRGLRVRRRREGAADVCGGEAGDAEAAECVEVAVDEDGGVEVDEAGGFGDSSRREARRPSQMSSAMTLRSRIESMGGLVTWANFCLK